MINLGLFKDFLFLFYRDRPSRNFAIATTLGLSFSLGVILSTLGLMDGFSKLLKEALNSGHGDIVITSQRGFFKKIDLEEETLNTFDIKYIAGMIRTQSFITSSNEEELGQGVEVYGVDDAFLKINQEFQIPRENEVVIGQKLAQHLQVGQGDRVSLTFARGRSGERYLPNIQNFIVKDIIPFKLHNFSRRFVFANLGKISSIVTSENKLNVLKLKLKDAKSNFKGIESTIEKLKSTLSYQYRVLPYWNEFGPFIEAVEFEKYMIVIVLSMVVILAIFNCVTFIVYSKEKKSQEIFLLYSIGLSPKKFHNMWFLQNLLLWLISFLLGLFFVVIFNLSLQYLPFLSLPEEVYFFSRLRVSLSLFDTILVLLFSLGLVVISTFLTMSRVNAKSLAQGLREEFS